MRILGTSTATNGRLSYGAVLESKNTRRPVGIAADPIADPVESGVRTTELDLVSTAKQRHGVLSCVSCAVSWCGCCPYLEVVIELLFCLLGLCLLLLLSLCYHCILYSTPMCCCCCCFLGLWSWRSAIPGPEKGNQQCPLTHLIIGPNKRIVSHCLSSFAFQFEWDTWYW